MNHTSQQSVIFESPILGITNGVFTLSIDYVGGGYLGEKFQRVIEVPCDMPLASLHGLVKQLTGFSDEKIHDFYVASSIRGKKVWLKRNGAWNHQEELSFDSTIDQVFVYNTGASSTTRSNSATTGFLKSAARATSSSKAADAAPTRAWCIRVACGRFRTQVPGFSLSSASTGKRPSVK